MLPEKNRLKKQKDFDSLFKNANTAYTKNFIMKAVPNNEDASRFAFMVSKKVSKRAVDRNRIRRQIRELIRLNLENITPGFDILIIVKATPTTLELKYNEIEKQVLFCLKKLRLQATSYKLQAKK